MPTWCACAPFLLLQFQHCKHQENKINTRSENFLKEDETPFCGIGSNHEQYHKQAMVVTRIFRSPLNFEGRGFTTHALHMHAHHTQAKGPSPTHTFSLNWYIDTQIHQWRYALSKARTPALHLYKCCLKSTRMDTLTPTTKASCPVILLSSKNKHQNWLCKQDEMAKSCYKLQNFLNRNSQKQPRIFW